MQEKGTVSRNAMVVFNSRLSIGALWLLVLGLVAPGVPSLSLPLGDLETKPLAKCKLVQSLVHAVEQLANHGRDAARKCREAHKRRMLNEPALGPGTTTSKLVVVTLPSMSQPYMDFSAGFFKLCCG